MIKVHYIKITKHVLLNLRRLIEGIPAGLQAKAMEFIYAPDQVRYVVGKLLLKSMLVESATCVFAVYDNNNKPIADQYDFFIESDLTGSS